MAFKKAFVIGDIHGMRGKLKDLLTYWDHSSERLIFLGDYVDRGPNSYQVIKQLRLLEKSYQAVCLRGNHEQILLEFLNSPQENWKNYQVNGGLFTIKSILDLSEEEILSLEPDLISQKIQEKVPWLINWLSGLEYFYEFGEFIVVHAGVDLSKDNWKESDPDDFMWIRQPFHLAENKTNKTIIFGHTPWNLLKQVYGSYGFLYQDNKIPIDGGAVYGGPLVGLRISEDEIIEQVEIS